MTPEKVIENNNQEIDNRVKRKVEQIIEILEKKGYYKTEFERRIDSNEEWYNAIAIIQNSGKYIAVQEGDTTVWRLYKNTNYELNNSMLLANKVQITLAFTTIFTLGITISIQFMSYQTQLKEIEIQKEQLEMQKMSQRQEFLKIYEIKEDMNSNKKKLDSVLLLK